ncbi:TetR/AcrR family transcriptional regulator [Nonomuraea jiangxiensis]|uniref:Regulatory protein, tetR family n=1 Tax=Nonomuraea jiangxiensis TaxID=633440 RepID=A0A1G8JPZ6_9ACTN|nr:TetR/AcrR family transcriptional regulator [Nonomuraea jiangxiensis]SDI33369.1 regulatory protein, tetR family [Nonomuraea jiangxiensis]
MGHAAAAPAVGRRERKKQATRAALREAALRLCVRHGVENVTVEQIAEEADIALRTFFNYFSSKEEAVMASVSSAAEELIAQFRARPRSESVLRAFREAVLVAMDDGDAVSRDHIEVLRLIRKAPSLVPQQLVVLAAQEQALAEAIAERVGLPAPHPGEPQAAEPTGDSVYPVVCAAAVLSALRVVLDRWLQQAAASDRPPSPALLARQFDVAIAELATGLDRPGRSRPRL